MGNKVKELAKKYFPAVSQIRRYLHAHPELSSEEFGTKEYIKEILDMLEIEHFDMLETGVVATIKGGHEGKVVLLRADMDALPINEEANVEYHSTVPGVMHACGHDGHVAGLLGAAMILNELKANISGTIKLMFQPAEEDEGGAERMIAAGILENPQVDAAFGLHLWGPLDADTVHVKSGAIMGAADFFDFKIIGRGGHAALPQETIDPINLCMQALNNMQNIVSRRVDPLDSVVLSFCTIHAGEASNVIPQDIEVNGTFRTLTKHDRETVPQMLEAVLKSVCDANGATYEFNLLPQYPAVINDCEMTELVKQSACKIIGKENVKDLEKPNMGGEDFAYLGQHVPSAFYFYGLRPKDASRDVIHHHPKFQWDDEILEGSSATLAQIAIDFLSGTHEDD